MSHGHVGTVAENEQSVIVCLLRSQALSGHLFLLWEGIWKKWPSPVDLALPFSFPIWPVSPNWSVWRGEICIHNSVFGGFGVSCGGCKPFLDLKASR